MFTGIIDHCGKIVQIELLPQGLKIWVKHNFTDLENGESIAIDGICLTVASFQDEIFCCDISPETLKITTARDFKVDQQVNLERALLPTTRMGGHFVMAHVDQIAQVTSIRLFNDFVEMTFQGINSLSENYLVKKGSIAINGVSLTINEVTGDSFKVMLIPHTLERTNLKNLHECDFVNIEFDMLARMVAKQIENLKIESSHIKNLDNLKLKMENVLA